MSFNISALIRVLIFWLLLMQLEKWKLDFNFNTNIFFLTVFDFSAFEIILVITPERLVIKGGLYRC